MKPFTVNSVNLSIRNVQYAVRGELAIKSEEYTVKLKEDGHGLPFDKIITSNLGNPQQKGLEQPPITFTRQVGNVKFEQSARLLKDSARWLR